MLGGSLAGQLPNDVWCFSFGRRFSQRGSVVPAIFLARLYRRRFLGDRCCACVMTLILPVLVAVFIRRLWSPDWLASNSGNLGLSGQHWPYGLQGICWPCVLMPMASRLFSGTGKHSRRTTSACRPAGCAAGIFRFVEDWPWLRRQIRRLQSLYPVSPAMPYMGGGRRRPLSGWQSIRHWVDYDPARAAMLALIQMVLPRA